MTYTEGQEVCSDRQSGLRICELSVSRILDYVLAQGLLGQSVRRSQSNHGRYSALTSITLPTQPHITPA